jgi:hypothetical protein
MLVKFWTQFARSGDPNGAEAPGTWVGLGLAISDQKNYSAEDNNSEFRSEACLG